MISCAKKKGAGRRGEKRKRKKRRKRHRPRPLRETTRSRKRSTWCSRPSRPSAPSAARHESLERRVPYFRRLPPELQRQLEQHIQVFVSEKQFVGCAGVEVSDEMRVAIAAQACLLVLNRKSDYFPGLRQILVYPGAF